MPMMPPRYTTKDPRYQLTSCSECRFGDHDRCLRTVTIRAGVMPGVYVCQCCGTASKIVPGRSVSADPATADASPASGPTGATS